MVENNSLGFLPAQPRKAEVLVSLLSHLLTADMCETVLKIMASKDRFEQDQAVNEWRKQASSDQTAEAINTFSSLFFFKRLQTLSHENSKICDCLLKRLFKVLEIASLFLEGMWLEYYLRVNMAYQQTMAYPCSCFSTHIFMLFVKLVWHRCVRLNSSNSLQTV